VRAKREQRHWKTHGDVWDIFIREEAGRYSANKAGRGAHCDVWSQKKKARFASHFTGQQAPSAAWVYRRLVIGQKISAAWLHLGGRLEKERKTTCKKRASHRKAADANSWEPGPCGAEGKGRKEL